MIAADAEFKLLVDCCRWPLGAAEQERVRESAAGADWPRFERLVRRHRVEGLAWRALAAAAVAVPPDVAGGLEQRALGIARENMLAAAECRRLGDAFRGAGIELLFVKGLTLGALAYGAIVLKAASDVDVLVAPDALLPACKLLRRLGYRPVLPYAGDDEDVERWHSISKETVWLAAGRPALELHTALADHPELIPGVGVRSPRQSVEIAGGVRLETLARDELFAYLCVHGASSAWFRLKWLADLAALLAGSGEAETGRLHERAVRLGAGTPAAAGLMLVHQLFGIAVAPERLRAWRRSAAVRSIVHASIKSMTGDRGEFELAQIRLGSIWVHVAQTAMVPSFPGKVTELRRQLLLSKRAREDRRSMAAAARGTGA